MILNVLSLKFKYGFCNVSKEHLSIKISLICLCKTLMFIHYISNIYLLFQLKLKTFNPKKNTYKNSIFLNIIRFTYIVLELNKTLYMIKKIKKSLSNITSKVNVLKYTYEKYFLSRYHHSLFSI